ncbi:MAG: hypothetical protein RMM98_11740 [Acidobacteriota bacterium]|nr:hypothetical protein [Blastocatellia bacterium]MDW8240280.1 hypothetical protein [Acidobacteriota bacterium]
MMISRTFFTHHWLRRCVALVVTLLAQLSLLHASPVGGQIPVETNNLPQQRPDVAYDTLASRYLVVYSEGVGAGQEIFAKLFRDNGTLLAGPVNISAHAGQPDDQPAVAFKAATNEYLVVWRYGVAGGNDIYARRVNSNGVPVGAPFPVSSTPADEGQPDVAADPLSNGLFLVAWHEVPTASNRGQFLTNAGALVGPSFQLFTVTRTMPRLSYGDSGIANYFVATTIDANTRVLARRVASGPALGPIMVVNATPAVMSPDRDAPVAFHRSVGRFLIAYIAQGANQIRGRFLDVAPNPVLAEVLIVPVGGVVRSLDVASGFDTNLQPRFIVSFDRLGDIFCVPLNGIAVVGPQEPINVDGVDNDSQPAVTFGRAPLDFFTVWQHAGPASPDILGQRHELP